MISFVQDKKKTIFEGEGEGSIDFFIRKDD